MGNRAALEASLKQINKEAGKPVVFTGKEAEKNGALKLRWIKTPSIELNNALHGGFAKIVELYGGQGSGKTSLVLDTIALNQKEDPDFIAAWLETEGSITDKIMKDHGIDMDRIIFWKQEDIGNAEKALDVARALLKCKNTEDAQIDMLVVNSIAGLSPKAEVEDDLEKQNIALTARIMSKFFRVANGFINNGKITAIFINQTRENVGQMFGDKTTTPGGKALGFYASQRIRLGQVKLEKKDPITQEEGVKISCYVKKNRVGNPPFTHCTYYATFTGGVDKYAGIPGIIQENGLMEVKGAHWYLLDENGKPVVIDGIEGHFSSRKEFVETLRNSDAWYNTITDIISSHVKAQQQTPEEQKQAQEENNALEAFMRETEANELEEALRENMEGE